MATKHVLQTILGLTIAGAIVYGASCKKSNSQNKPSPEATAAYTTPENVKGNVASNLTQQAYAHQGFEMIQLQGKQFEVVTNRFPSAQALEVMLQQPEGITFNPTNRVALQQASTVYELLPWHQTGTNKMTFKTKPLATINPLTYTNDTATRTTTDISFTLPTRKVGTNTYFFLDAQEARSRPTNTLGFAFMPTNGTSISVNYADGSLGLSGNNIYLPTPMASEAYLHRAHQSIIPTTQNGLPSAPEN